MTSFQKVIKGAAICFAIFLTVTIVGTIGKAAFGLVTVVTNTNMGKIEEIAEDYDNADILSISIDNSVGKLSIVQGDGFRVEGVSVGNNFKTKVTNDGTLKVTNKDVTISWFTNFFDGKRSGNSEITIYVPEGFKAKKIDIDNGVGELYMEDMETAKLDIDLGTGDCYGKNIVSDKTDINGGVGSVHFKDVTFTDLELECGVGDLTIEGKILGKSEINCGVGSLELITELKKEDYELDIETGLGDIYINGEKTSNIKNANQGAKHSLDIEGGISEVEIEFSK